MRLPDRLVILTEPERRRFEGHGTEPPSNNLHPYYFVFTSINWCSLAPEHPG
jgi:hypothetical protein